MKHDIVFVQHNFWLQYTWYYDEHSIFALLVFTAHTTALNTKQATKPGEINFTVIS